MTKFLGRKVLIQTAALSVSVVAINGCARTAIDPTREPASTREERHEPAHQAPLKVEQDANRAWKESAANAEYHFAMAQAYSAEGQIPRAIEEYRLAILKDPKSALLHVRLSAEYIKKGEVAEATESAKRAIELDPKFVDAHLILAGLYSTNKLHEEALREYDLVLKLNPSPEQAEETVIYKAQVHLEADRPEESVGTLKAWIAKNPKSSLAWYYLGRIEQARENLTASESAYRKAMENREGFTQAMLGLAGIYEAQGKNARAIEVYQQAYDDAQDPTAANRLVTLLLKDEKYSEALPILEALRALDPKNLNVRVKLGLIQMKLGKFADAVVSFNEILAQTPESDRVRYYLGMCHEELKELDQAIAHYRLVPSDSGVYEDAILHAAYLLKDSGKTSEARSVVRAAIQASGSVAAFHLFAANLEEEQKAIPEAIRILERAVQALPDHEKLRYYLGSLYDRTGNIEKGLTQMEEILRINPNQPDAMNYIGYTWTSQGVNMDRAGDLLKKAVSISPNNAYIVDSYGWWLFRTGKVEQAIVELERAYALKRDEPSILEHLGDVYLSQGLREKALAKYTDSLRVQTDDSERSKMQAKVDALSGELRRNRGIASEPKRGPASTAARPE